MAWMKSGTIERVRQYPLAVDDDDAFRHQPGAEGHHQRLNAEQSDADAVDRPHRQPQPEADRDRRAIAELAAPSSSSGTPSRWRR